MAFTHLLLNFIVSHQWVVGPAELRLVTCVCTGAFRLTACWNCFCLLLHHFSDSPALAAGNADLANCLQSVPFFMIDSAPGWNCRRQMLRAVDCVFARDIQPDVVGVNDGRHNGDCCLHGHITHSSNPFSPPSNHIMKCIEHPKPGYLKESLLSQAELVRSIWCPIGKQWSLTWLPAEVPVVMFRVKGEGKRSKMRLSSASKASS